MVSFTDFKKLRRGLAKKPIEGCMLGLEKVPLSTDIQVFGIRHISEDSLSAYLENTRRSGGSGEVSVDIHREEQAYALATFESNQSKSF